MKDRNMEKRLIAGAKAFEAIMKEQEQQKLHRKNDEALLSDILSEIAEHLYQAADLASEAAELIEDDGGACPFPYFIMEVCK